MPLPGLQNKDAFTIPGSSLLRTFSLFLLSMLPLAAASADSVTLADRLVAEAKKRTEVIVVYDGAYRAIDYPLGDVPNGIGVCTDVVIRAYRGVGIDLQVRVHEDMQREFSAYPTIWGAQRPDRNIDHRRVPNLQAFFRRHGEALVVSERADQYQPGDIVTWMLPGNLPHIGVVSDHRAPDGDRFMVIHNIGQGPVEDDSLFRYPVTGHYRYDESSVGGS